MSIKYKPNYSESQNLPTLNVGKDEILKLIKSTENLIESYRNITPLRRFDKARIGELSSIRKQLIQTLDEVNKDIQRLTSV